MMDLVQRQLHIHRIDSIENILKLDLKNPDTIKYFSVWYYIFWFLILILFVHFIHITSLFYLTTYIHIFPEYVHK